MENQIMADLAHNKTSVYGMFVGELNQASVKSLTHSLGIATQEASDLNLILQTTGGTVSEGVYLYNLIRTMPIPIAIYNIGSVCSAGVMAYLGASKRVSSKFASFMIHRCQASPQGANPAQLSAVAESLTIDDERMDEILRSHLNLSPEQWETYNRHSLWIGAKTAIETGFATEIGEFCAPIGSPIYAFGV
jgi:ATP-dependent Clp protease, protease subunit